MALLCPTGLRAQVVFKDAAFDPPLPPVPVEKIHPVLDRDLAGQLRHGALGPGTHGGIVIGIVQHGTRRIFAYGSVKPDGVFEIGSITKTFTGLLLAQAIEQNRIRLDEPVRILLPGGLVQQPAGREITVRDLTTQHSGLPSNPTGIDPTDPSNAYADYDANDLYAYLHVRGVRVAPGTGYEYSNTGMKLLGQLLALKAGEPYDDLLRQQVLAPLGMNETAVVVTAEMRRHLVQGYDEQHQPTASPVAMRLPGASSLRSTAADMLTYLEAELRPERIPATGAGKTLPGAIRLSQRILASADPGMHIAMNWFHSDADGSFQHGGIMDGSTSMALFDPQRDYGVVVLSNTNGDQHSLAIRLANHVAQRLSGLPALSLEEPATH